MPPAIASVACAFLIVALFWLDRDRQVRTSWSLWISVLWLMLACSRSVSQWLQVGPSFSSADQVLEGNPLDRAVYTGFLLVGLIVLVVKGRRVGRLLWTNGTILLFFLYCVLSILWSDYPDVAFKRWTKALGDLVMILVVLSDRELLVAVKRLLARATFVLIPLSILLIKYYPNIGTEYSPWGGKAEYRGVTLNKNTLGAICLLLGLGSLWRFISAYQGPKSTDRNRRLIAHGAILGMVVWLFWIANSMTSLNCFLMAGALLLLTNSRAVIRRPAVVHLFIASMLAVSVSVLFFGVDPAALETMGRNPTLTDRTEVWGVLLSLVRNPLVGTGFESFWLGPRLEKMWSTYWWHPNEAHNGYLEVYLNLGWIGVALLVVIIATGYRTVFSAWRSNASTGSLRMAYFLVGAVYNFTEAAFFKMLAPVWIFFLFAIVSVPERPNLGVRPSMPNQFRNKSPLIKEHAEATLGEGVG